ncbi:hypothetical protein ACIBQ1_54845 [Nonomuraea sp. NPDC050153]
MGAQVGQCERRAAEVLLAGDGGELLGGLWNKSGGYLSTARAASGM